MKSKLIAMFWNPLFLITIIFHIVDLKCNTLLFSTSKSLNEYTDSSNWLDTLNSNVNVLLFPNLFANALSSTDSINQNIDNFIPANDFENYDYYIIQIETPLNKRDTANGANSNVVIHDRDNGAWHSLKARDVANNIGYHFLGQVGELRDYFMIAVDKKDRVKRSSDPNDEIDLIKNSLDQDIVSYVSYQEPERRLFHRGVLNEKGDTISCKDGKYIGQIEPIVNNTESSFLLRVRDFFLQSGASFNNYFNKRGLSSILSRSSFNEFKDMFGISDPDFSRQWHLYNQWTSGNDLNIGPVWEKNITGKGAVVCFLDDGLDFDAPDLKENFYAAGSYDFNDHVSLPKPQTDSDRHGTRCAGEVAAVKNDVCGVGVAYNAKVSGVRILGGKLTEADEAKAINYDFHNNHIYSCSWGPRDDGRSMEAPPKIAKDAVYNGIVNGRNGKGSIFVFASGNGGASGDACNFDGYTNSIYTITVGSIDKDNSHPIYSEACTANMIVTYSSNSEHHYAIFTTDFKTNSPSSCTDNHGGTSAAAPLASGLLALVLEIRPELTWRDMQRLVMESGIQINPDDPTWGLTHAGRPYSPVFGYGKLDADRLIENAQAFVPVGKQVTMNSVESEVNLPIPFNEDGVGSVIRISEEDIEKSGMKVLEHITITVTIEHQRRGDVEVYLRSPNGIVDVLSPGRPNDVNTGGFKEWTFMTVQHFDETPIGDWMIIVKDRVYPETTGKFLKWKMTLYGDDTSRPEHSDDSTKNPDSNPSKEGKFVSYIKEWASKLYSKVSEHKKESTVIAWVMLLIVVLSISICAFVRKRSKEVIKDAETSYERLFDANEMYDDDNAESHEFKTFHTYNDDDNITSINEEDESSHRENGNDNNNSNINNKSQPFSI